MPSVNSLIIFVSYFPLWDESLQEQLWEISMNALRAHLSPEVLERYGEAIRGSTQSATVEGRHNGSEVEQARAVELTEQSDMN